MRTSLIAAGIALGLTGLLAFYAWADLLPLAPPDMADEVLGERIYRVAIYVTAVAAAFFALAAAIGREKD